MISAISCDASLGPWGTAFAVSTRHPNIGTARRFTTRQKWTEWSQFLWSTERRGACSKETDTIATRQIFLLLRIVIQILDNLGVFAIIGKHGKTYEFTMIWVNLSDVTRPPPFKVAFTIVGGMLRSHDFRWWCRLYYRVILLHSIIYCIPLHSIHPVNTVFKTYHTR